MSLRPAFGARYAVDRVDGEPGADVLYRGFVHLPDADLPLVVRVGEAGATAVVEAPSAPPPARAELERAAASLVRAAVRAPLAEARTPPRRIVRWR
jgi:hypothetical protein